MTIDARGKLIDAHIHVHSPHTFPRPLAPGFERSDLWQPSMTPADIARIAARFGDIRANLVQPTWYALDHGFLIECIAAGNGRFVGTGVVPALSDVAFPRPERAMARLAESGVRAFRIRGRSARAALGQGARWLDAPAYDAMFQRAADNALSLSFLASVDDLPEIARLCNRFPDTRVIIDHVAGVRPLGGCVDASRLDALLRMSHHPSVMVKLGPFYALSETGPPYLDLLPMLRRVIAAFGAERCMWESDLGGPILMAEPDREYAASVDLIRARCDFLSDEEVSWILWRTAETAFSF